MRKHLLCLVVVLPGLPCAGESINVDFGLPGAGPSATYGAARLAGVWNSIEGQHTPFTDPQVIYDLVDIDGEATGVTLYQFGGQDLVAEDDPSVTGDHALLLNDALVTHSQGLETCLWINGLENLHKHVNRTRMQSLRIHDGHRTAGCHFSHRYETN